MFVKRNRKSSGVTLVEVSIAIAVTGIVVMAIAAYLSQQQKSVKLLESTLRMTSIAQAVQRALADPAVISFSAYNGHGPGNMQLQNCIAPPSSKFNSKTLKWNNAPFCTATNPAAQVSFDLILPIKGGAPITPAAVEKNTVAGSSNNPALYKILDGTTCARGTNSPACNLKVTAHFWATCPPVQSGIGNFQSQTGVAGGTKNYQGPGGPQFTGAICPAAQSINLRFQVAYAPGPGADLKNVLKIPNIPPDKIFKAQPTFGAITIPVNTIPGPANPLLFCPTNSTLIGVKNGVPECQCMFPYKKAPGCVAGETCACIDVDKTCTANERYRGININTGDIICCPVYCVDVKVDSSSGPAGCGIGGWIESITPEYVPPPPTVAPTNPSAASGGGAAPPPLQIVQSSCGATQLCQLGKWGGSCSAEVKCIDHYKCCYEYGGTTGSACNSGH